MPTLAYDVMSELTTQSEIYKNFNTLLREYKNKPAEYPENAVYSGLLLATISLPQSEYVHQAYASKTYTIKKNEKQAVLKRRGVIAPTANVFGELNYPKPDQVGGATYVTVGTAAYARWFQFTKKYQVGTFDDELGYDTQEEIKAAGLTGELLARRALLASPSVFFPAGKLSFGELTLNDRLFIEDLLLLDLIMNRSEVMPFAGGYFHLICSPEFINDLKDDPYFRRYIMSLNNSDDVYRKIVTSASTTIKHLVLFDRIALIPTKFDEMLYPELSNPGQFYTANGDRLRIFAQIPIDDSVIGGTITSGWELLGVNVYANVKAGTVGTVADEAAAITDASARKYLLTNYYHSTGSYVAYKEYWRLDNLADADLDDETVEFILKNKDGEIVIKVIDGATGATNSETPKFEGIFVTKTNIIAKLNAAVSANAGAEWKVQLPVHKAIFVGEDGLVKVLKEGLSDAVEVHMIPPTPQLVDPFGQKGFATMAINSLGFGIVRPEAVWVLHSVPKAALATIGLFPQIPVDPRIKVVNDVIVYGDGQAVSDPDDLGLVDNKLQGVRPYAENKIKDVVNGITLAVGTLSTKIDGVTLTYSVIAGNGYTIGSGSLVKAATEGTYTATAVKIIGTKGNTQFERVVVLAAHTVE